MMARRTLIFACGALCIAALVLGQRVHAQQSATDLMIQSRSQEQPQPSARRIPLPPGNPLEVLPVQGGVFMIAGGPSNIAVQIGVEGALLVDAGTAEISDKVLEAIRAVSTGPINYIIDTTPEKDHYGGNAKIGAAGSNPTVAPRGLAGPGSVVVDNQGGGGNNPQGLRPDGAIVFAHENLLNRMSAPTGETPAEPFALWPTSTFFTAAKTISFNDEAIEMLHAPAAHTDADVIVFFRKSDVVATGDIINTLQYPFFDHKRGGSIQGILDALNDVIEITVPRFNQMAGTRVVPGHGRILNEADVVEYRDMMTIIRDRVKVGVEQGKTLAQIKGMRPTLDYDGLYSVPSWTGEMLIDAIDEELRQPAHTATAH
jgi:glyoxylase-like metal-dependent hydrolase (beta-lactamase superfamily II)